MNFRRDIFGHGLVACMVLLTSLSAYAQPSWVTGFPQILSGATSADIKVQTDSSGTIYYAIYKTVQSGITSTQLKSDALGGTNPNLVKRGSATIPSNTIQTLKQIGLTQNTTYHIYAVAESNGGLMANNKISYTARFFPKRQQEFYNYSNSVMNSYLMYFPEDYYKSTSGYPLLVFLGGSGELSHGGAPNPDLLESTGLPQVINLGKELPMIVASPQGIWSWNGSHTFVDAYIEFLKATYRIDASQIFLTGLSDGGEGVFDYANAYPSKLKAIVPVSTWPIGADIHNFTSLPVWAFMGSSDTNGQLHQWINALKAIGGNATYTEYPGGHSGAVWNPVYDGSKGDNIYPWMLTAAPLPPANIPPVVNAGADQTVSLPLPQLLLTGTASDVDGTIASYAWTKISGPAVTLTNPNTSILTLTNITPGPFVFQLKVLDNVGASATDQVTIYVNVDGTVSREFDVNITWPWNIQGGTWNDFITTGGGIVGNSTTLFDTHNIPSPLSLSIIAPFQDGTNNHGVYYSAIYPGNVMQYFLRSTTTKAGALKLSGLNVSKLYDLSILSSNTDLWYPSDTRLTVNGQVATVNAAGNATQLVNFLSVLPNLSGEITIDVAPATTNPANIGIINALVLKERPNIPPVVSAGPDQQTTLPISQLLLSGTATDTDGTIASWLWTEVSGPAVTMTNAITSTLTLTNLLAGTYVFQLSAQDNGSAITNDQVTVTVNPVINIAPVVDAGPDQQITLPLSQLQLVGTAIDTDGTLAAVIWTEVSGPSVTMTNTNPLTLTLTNLLAGTYVFQLSVQDNVGAITNDQVTVVADINIAPVVNAGAGQQVTLPLSQLQLTGTATDSDGTIASLLWTKIAGPTVTLANDTTSTLQLTNILSGTYVFQLSAQDNSGATATGRDTVIVHPPPREFDINVTWAWNKGGLPWNDLITANGGIVGTSATLSDKNGVLSPITISITAPFVDGVNNHGVWPGLYPNNVMMYYLRSTTTMVGALKLAGLNAAKQYDLSILSSNVDVWYSSTTLLTVQGQSATINAKGNASQLVNFKNISPTAMGEIPITVAPATTNPTNCGVINAIILTEHDAGSPGARTTTQEVAMEDPEKPSSPPGDYVNVFPNPIEDHINVEINSSLPTPETFSIEFTDIRGTQVYARQVESQDGTNTISEKISADFMQSGLYIVAVRGRQSGVQYFKIVKK